MRIAYYRVSSKTQKHDMQEFKLLQTAGFDKVYKEKVSGVKKLAELERCLADLREGDVLIVYKLDRLGRTTLSIVRSMQTVLDKKADLISISEGLDSTTPMGRAMMQFSAILSEIEYYRIKERTADGREAAKARGVRFGRPEGSGKKDPDNSIVILYNAGQKIEAIQKALQIKSRDTIYRKLEENGIRPNRRNK